MQHPEGACVHKRAHTKTPAERQLCAATLGEKVPGDGDGAAPLLD